MADGADVKTAFFTVYRFERIFGSAEAFYEAYFEVAMREHAEQEMLLSIGEDMGYGDEWPSSGQRKETSLDGVNYDLNYFDTIELIAPINMGFAALATKTFSGHEVGGEDTTAPSSSSSKVYDVGTGPGSSSSYTREYVLKRLNKSAVCAQVSRLVLGQLGD